MECLATEHPGAPRGLDTIVGRGECLQISTGFVAFTGDSKAPPPPGYRAMMMTTTTAMVINDNDNDNDEDKDDDNDNHNDNNGGADEGSGHIVWQGGGKCVG